MVTRLQELQERHAVLRDKQRCMLNSAKSEERNFTDKEQEAFDTLSLEKRMLENEMASLYETPTFEETKETEGRHFRNFADEVMKRGTAGTLEFRDDAEKVTNAASVAATTPMRFQGLIAPLESNFILSKLGVRMQHGVAGQSVWGTYKSISVHTAGENEEAKKEKIEFDTLKTTPHRLTVEVPVSRRAFHQSGFELYSLVLDLIGKAAGRKLNELLCATKASASEIKGPFIDIDASNTLTYKAGKLGWADMVALETVLLNKNVDVRNESPAYIIGSKVQGVLKTTPLAQGDSRMLLDVGSFTTNGYNVEMSNSVEDGNVLFGAFENLVVTYFDGANLTIDPFTYLHKNMVRFVLNMDVDFTRLRKEAFAVLKLGAGVGA